MSTRDFVVGHVEFATTSVAAPARTPRSVSEITTMIEAVTPEMRRRLAKLDALEAFGVDNWDGYSEAMQSLREKNNDDDDA